MSVHPIEPPTDGLIPRPERTPEALRLALAGVAPHRLGEMEQQKNEAFTLAAEHNNLGPIRQWLTIWAAEVEIERRPDLAARRRNAERAAHTLDRDDPAWRAAMDEVLAVLNEAGGRAGPVPPLPSTSTAPPTRGYHHGVRRFSSPVACS